MRTLTHVPVDFVAPKWHKVGHFPLRQPRQWRLKSPAYYRDAAIWRAAALLPLFVGAPTTLFLAKLHKSTQAEFRQVGYNRTLQGESRAPLAASQIESNR